MSDVMDCPDCDGIGVDQLATGLTVACRFCCGRGWVGGEHEPAEDKPLSDAATIPHWKTAGAEQRAEAFGCRQCLGTGLVVHVGDIRRPTKLVEVDCPVCGPTRAQPPRSAS